ncbi:hypothetical protein Tco_0673021 [Tanacetum coccineum]
MLFNVVDTDACHIILGKPLVYHLNAIYNIEDNSYKFQHNGGRFILVPLMEINHVSEPKGHNSFKMGYQDFEEERKYEFLVNSTITTTMIQDETSIKILKNLKLLDEVSQALIPDELQPILCPMQDIPLPIFPGHNIDKEHMVQKTEVIHGGNSRTSCFQEGGNDAILVGIGITIYQNPYLGGAVTSGVWLQPRRVFRNVLISADLSLGFVLRLCNPFHDVDNKSLSSKDTSKMDSVADEPVAEYVKEVDVTTKGVLYWEEGKLGRVVVPVSVDATQQEALLWLKNLKIISSLLGLVQDLHHSPSIGPAQ